MTDFVIYNGEILAADKVPVGFNNRAFKYGDSVFETVRCNGNFPLHFSFHYQRLIHAFLQTKMDFTSFPRQEELENMVAKLLKKKSFYKSSRIRIEAFRAGAGLYTPQENKINFIIEATPLASENYQLNVKGLLVDVYRDMKKMYSPISSFKNGNALHYILAACFKKEQRLDDCLLLNDQDKIIEGNSSNLFWVKDGTLYTPSVFSGCVDGVMRKVIMQLVKETKFINLVETQGATESELLNADELFLSNAIQGIQWIVGFKSKRYFHNVSRQLSSLLNETYFS